MTVKCIVIEDEPPATELLSRFICQTGFLHLQGCFDNAPEGLSFVQNNEVELVFLDIEMPDVSGLELARMLHAGKTGKSPAIIFTTAFDQFAIEGYKLDVVDYLLKPFDYEDFLRAAGKAQQLIALKAGAATQPQMTDEYLFLKVEHQVVKIPYSDIVCIEGFKDYAKVQVLHPQRTILSLITLKALEEKLPPEQFMRIHRSTIVSVDKITAVTKSSVDINGQLFPVSDQYKDNFGKLLDKWR